MPKSDSLQLSQYTLPDTILEHILNSFNITHSYFSSPVTCPTILLPIPPRQSLRINRINISAQMDRTRICPPTYRGRRPTSPPLGKTCSQKQPWYNYNTRNISPKLVPWSPPSWWPIPRLTRYHTPQGGHHYIRRAHNTTRTKNWTTDRKPRHTNIMYTP